MTTASVPPLGKYLASTDKKTRDRAIKNLAVFLSDPSRDALSKSEMDKLWKGIFYCFWMSDKPLVQQALASELAEILLTIPSAPASLGFLRGFWETTVREWNGIDRLRIDKYLMLIRRFVNASFRLLLRSDWEESSCDEYSAILTAHGGPLCPEDVRIPAGLPFHLCDIYLEELDKIYANAAASSSSPAPLLKLVLPFIDLAARTPTMTTYKHVQSTVFGPLFEALTSVDNDHEPAVKRQRLSNSDYAHLLRNVSLENPEVNGRVDRASLRKALARRIFEVASHESTRDANRRRMYAFWRSIDDGDGSDSDAT